jgi:hypothetical protein
MPRSIGRRAGALRRALGIHQAIPKLFADDANCLIFTVMLATLRKAFWACIVILRCLAPSANAAGIQLFNHGPALSGAIWYPCQAEPKHVDLGDQGAGVDYGLVGVKDCPITGAKLPLVVSSHGTAGWFGGHHDTAAALADAGFVVAAINHSGDNGNDRSKSDDLSVLGSRPADIAFFRTNRPAPVLAPSLHSLQVLTR